MKIVPLGALRGGYLQHFVGLILPNYLLNDIAMSPTALGSAVRGTNRGTRAKRMGLCIADAEPSAVASNSKVSSLKAPKKVVTAPVSPIDE